MHKFIQSPIGLVPKGSDGKQKRLIFHLSYNFPNGNLSYNAHTPDNLCKVKYKDLDYAVRQCLELINISPDSHIWLGICDVKSAFRLVPGARKFWPLLMMRASNPVTGQVAYFLDKCLPFGAGVSCALFQEFSESLAQILMYLIGPQRAATCRVVNYLDDFLFIATSQHDCNTMVRTFIELASELKVPIAVEKTIWATTCFKFLGILIDGKRRMLMVPPDKRERARHMLQVCVDRKKATVKEVERLSGYLNFLNKAIFPGRAFTRRMYAKIDVKIRVLKPHHHINLDIEFRSNCQVWLKFLDHTDTQLAFSRPFVDLSYVIQATTLDLYTDSSANGSLGFGGIYGRMWFFGKWESGYIAKFAPNIQYLELYAVCMAVFIWKHHLANLRFVVHCDNKPVVRMLDETTSGCKHCMHLIRLLTIHCLKYNMRVFGVHVRGIHNSLSDSLSRLQFK